MAALLEHIPGLAKVQEAVLHFTTLVHMWCGGLSHVSCLSAARPLPPAFPSSSLQVYETGLLSLWLLGMLDHTPHGAQLELTNMLITKKCEGFLLLVPSVARHVEGGQEFGMRDPALFVYKTWWRT